MSDGTVCLESEFLLGHIAERHDDDRCKDLRNRRVKMQVFDKQLDEYIIKEYAKHYQQEVPEQLHSAFQDRAWKYNIAVQQVTGRKADGKCDQEGCDMRADGTSGRVHHPLYQDEIIRNEIEKDVEDGVAASTNSIAKGLQWHQSAEGRIKEIDDRDEHIP